MKSFVNTFTNIDLFSLFFQISVDELPEIVGELKTKFKDDFGIDIDNGKFHSWT